MCKHIKANIHRVYCLCAYTYIYKCKRKCANYCIYVLYRIYLHLHRYCIVFLAALCMLSEHIHANTLTHTHTRTFKRIFSTIIIIIARVLRKYTVFQYGTQLHPKNIFVAIVVGKVVLHF